MDTKDNNSKPTTPLHGNHNHHHHHDDVIKVSTQLHANMLKLSIFCFFHFKSFLSNPMFQVKSIAVDGTVVYQHLNS